MIPANLTGADLLVGVAVIAALSVTVAYGLFELGVYVRKRFGTWHDRVTLKNGPIPFESRPVESSGWWAIGTTVALVAIWGAAYWGTK